MMALAAANSPWNQARMASLAKGSETSSGGCTIAGGGSVRDAGTAAMGRGKWFKTRERERERERGLMICYCCNEKGFDF